MMNYDGGDEMRQGINQKDKRCIEPEIP